VAASEATSATTPRRSRGRPSQWQRDNPDLAERQAEFFHLWDDPGSWWRSGSRLTTGTSVASATVTTRCAAGARAVGTRRGDGPS